MKLAPSRNAAIINWNIGVIIVSGHRARGIGGVMSDINASHVDRISPECAATAIIINQPWKIVMMKCGAP